VRLALEHLEDRTLLSGLPLDQTITNSLENANSVVKDAITTLDSNLFGILDNSLPLIGTAFTTLQKAQDFFLPIGQAFTDQFTALKQLGPTIYDTNVEDAITTAIQSLPVPQPLPTLAPIVEKNLTDNGTAVTNFQLNLDVTGTLVDSKFSPNFDLGLKQMGLTLTGNVNVSLGYEFKVGLGIDDTGFYIDGTGTSFALTLAVTTPQLKLSGNLFFLQVTAMDGNQEGQTTSFNASIGISLSDNNMNSKIYLAGSPDLNLGASLNASADAEVHMGMTLGFNAQGFPSLDADFDMSWKINAGTVIGPNSNTTDPNFGDQGGTPDEPDIAFHHIGLDIGSFFSQFVSPVVQEVKSVLDPIEPVIKVLETRIPVLSDIPYLKEQAFGVGPNDPVRLLDVIKKFGDNPAIKFLDTVTALDNLVNSVPSVNGNVVIPLGDFNLMANQLDVRSADLTKSPLTTVNANASQILSELQNTQIVPQGVADFIKNITTNVNFGGTGGDDGGGIHFPIIDNPQSAFGILLGQDVDLFDFDMPTLRASPTFEQFFPILGPLGVDFRGVIPEPFGGNPPLDATAKQNTALEAVFHFTFGYDSYGLNQFWKTDKFNINKISDLVNGFFVSNNFQPILKLYAGFGAFAELKLPAFDAGVGGGIIGNVLFNLHNPDSQGNVHLDQILSETTGSGNGPLGVFDISGKLTADLEAFIKIGFQSPFGFVGYENDFDIAHAVLLDFDFKGGNDPIPALATPQPGGKLLLNMGPVHAKDRVVGDLSDHDESFNVSDGGPSPNGSGEKVFVTAYGYQQEYDGVQEIDAFCGPGDSVTINQGVTADASLVGGNGGNQLIYHGSGNDTLVAMGGDNVLSGGFGSNYLDATQATGGDTLIGGNGSNEFHAAMMAPFGGLGDKMLAGPHGDKMFGGSGIDTFSAGAGNDMMNGGSSGAVFSWQEGDGNPTVIGGSGLAKEYQLQADVAKPGAQFLIQHGQSMQLEVDITIPGGNGPNQILAQNVGEVSVDGLGDFATYDIQPLIATGVQYVQVNEHEASQAGGGSDQVTVYGSPALPNMVDISADPNVTAANSQEVMQNYTNGNNQTWQVQTLQPIVPPLSGPVTNVDLTILGSLGPFGGGNTNYQVATAIPKTTDALTVNTGSANDKVSVESTQSADDGTSQGGSVFVNTIAGNNIINVGTSHPGQGLGLLDRIQGNLYIDAGTGTQNQLNVDEGYAVNGDTLALTANHVFNGGKSNQVFYQIQRYFGEDLSMNPDGGGAPIPGSTQPPPPPEPQRYAMFIQYGVETGGAYGAGVNVYLTRNTDRLYVTDTMSGAPTTIYSDGNMKSDNPLGPDKIVVGYNPLDLNPPNSDGIPRTPQDSFLDNLKGPLDVEGTDGAKNAIGDVDLQLFDEAAATEQYQITASQVARVGILPISYHDLGIPNFPGVLELFASNSGNTIGVGSTAKDTTTKVYTGTGGSSILVGKLLFPPPFPPLYSLDSIQGALNINGGGGVDDLMINDDHSFSNTYQMTATALQRLGGISIAPINFTQMNTVELDEPISADTITLVSGTALGTTVSIYTGDGNDGLNVGTLDQIQGPLNFVWSSGLKSLVVDDTSAMGANTYTVDSLELDRTGAAKIQYDLLNQLEVFLPLGPATIVDIPSIAFGTGETFVAGNGDTLIYVAGPGDVLDNIQGSLSVQGGGNTTMYLEDQNSSVSRGYDFEVDHVQSRNIGAIQYTNLSGLVLDASTFGTNNIGIDATASGTQMTVNAGTKDQVQVGFANFTLQNIQGPLDVVGTSTDVSLELIDTSGNPLSLYKITATELDHAPSAAIQYQGLSQLILLGSTDGDVYDVQSFPAQTSIDIGASGVQNLLEGPDTDNTWKFQRVGQLVRYVLDGNIGFIGIQNLRGGSGADDFQFLGTGFLGSIDGGSGTDTLDFSQLVGPVSVTLNQDGATDGVNGMASVLSGNFSNIDSLIGSSPGSTLDGSSYSGDFTHTLTVSGFDNMNLQVPGNFSGSLLASSEGTPGLPVKIISIGGTMGTNAVIKTNFLQTFDVSGNMDGVLKGFGIVNGQVDGSDITIQTITISGTFGSGADIIAPVLAQADINQYAGHIQETEPTKDMQLLKITGSLAATGSVQAGSIADLEVGQDLAGTVNVTGPIGILHIGGNLSGSVTAGSINTVAILGDLSGSLTVSGLLGNLSVTGIITGLVSGGQITTLSGCGVGPTILSVIQGGISRQVLADPVDPSLAPMMACYYYDGTTPTPQVGVRLYSPYPDTTAQYDLTLQAGGSEQFDLAYLDTPIPLIGGVRDLTVDGSVLGDIGSGMRNFFNLGIGVPGGIQMAFDTLRLVTTTGDFAGTVNVMSIYGMMISGDLTATADVSVNELGKEHLSGALATESGVDVQGNYSGSVDSTDFISGVFVAKDFNGGVTSQNLGGLTVLGNFSGVDLAYGGTGDVTINGYLAGTINVGSTFNVMVGGDLSGVVECQEINSTISVGGNLSGRIRVRTIDDQAFVQGDLTDTGQITATGDAGSIDMGGKLAGSIFAGAIEAVFTDTITCSGTVTSSSYLENLQVFGDLDGTVNVAGDLHQLFIEGNLGGSLSAGQIEIGTIGGSTMNGCSGGMGMMSSGISVGSLIAVLSVGGDLADSVKAGSINSLSIGGSLTGNLDVYANVNELMLGRDLSGSVDAGSIGSASVGGDFTGKIVVMSMGTFTVAGANLGAITASPTIATQASPGGLLGTVTLTDTATLSGGYSVNGGTIVFTLTAPDNSFQTETVPVTNGDNTYTTPTGIAATMPGVYRWSARYSGNATNNPATDNGQNESTTVTSFSISGSVYDDLTENGFSSDDPKLSTADPNYLPVTVNLFQNGGTAPFATTTTDANGDYSFTRLGAGSYSVSEVVPTGCKETANSTPATSGHTGRASAGPSASGSVTATGGGSSTQNDFDNFKYGQITGTVFHDVTGNGWSSDDIPLSVLTGPAAFLLYKNGALQSATAQNTAGAYSFAHLDYGVYDVVEITLPTWVLTANSTPGGPLGHTGAATTGPSGSGAVVLTSGLKSTGNDFDNAHVNQSDMTGAFGIGFWKNHSSLITAGDLQFLSTLSLRNPNGSRFTFPYTNFATLTKSQLAADQSALANYLGNATLANPASMLSAQLVAMELNVRWGSAPAVGDVNLTGLSANAIIYDPGLAKYAASTQMTGLYNGGFISVANLMATANSELALYGSPAIGSFDFNFENELRNAITLANLNLDFVS
jgi:hypothetical protein